MALYDRPVRELMQDAAKELGATTKTPVSRQAFLDWFDERYPKVKRGTVNAHLLRMSVNSPSRVHHNVPSSGGDDLLFQLGPQSFRLYDPASDPEPIYPGGDELESDDLPEEEGVEGSSRFAYERDLSNYLAKNLGVIESGLRLYEEEGINGVEYPVGGRFIDILAEDSEGDLVVIELKVSRGYDRVVGQLLRYMGWVEEHVASDDQKVRGIIIAKEISQDLILACRRVPGVELFEYDLQVTVHTVARGA